jgi:hypothetical protein
MSKGSKKRPQTVSQQQFEQNWDKIFKNNKKKKNG